MARRGYHEEVKDRQGSPLAITLIGGAFMAMMLAGALDQTDARKEAIVEARQKEQSALAVKERRGDIRKFKVISMNDLDLVMRRDFHDETTFELADTGFLCRLDGRVYLAPGRTLPAQLLPYGEASCGSFRLVLEMIRDVKPSSIPPEDIPKIEISRVGPSSEWISVSREGRAICEYHPGGILPPKNGSLAELWDNRETCAAAIEMIM